MPHLHMIQWPDSGFGIRIPKKKNKCVQVGHISRAA